MKKLVLENIKITGIDHSLFVPLYTTEAFREKLREIEYNVFPEPENPADPDAIVVCISCCSELNIGYIARETTKVVHKHIAKDFNSESNISIWRNYFIKLNGIETRREKNDSRCFLSANLYQREQPVQKNDPIEKLPSIRDKIINIKTN